MNGVMLYSPAVSHIVRCILIHDKNHQGECVRVSVVSPATWLRVEISRSPPCQQHSGADLKTSTSQVK